MSVGDTVKSVLKGMPVMLTGGQPGYRAGDAKLAWAKESLKADDNLQMSSAVFKDGEPIPVRCSTDGENISPALAWTSAAAGVVTFALVVEDPDAPTPEPFVHWLIYNIPASVEALPENVEKEPVAASVGGAAQGKNSNFAVGWSGMAPPKGDTPHRYVFQLFALDMRLHLEPGAGRRALFDAMAGHVVGRGRLIGTFQRS